MNVVLTVCIPAYNAEEYISEAIESVVNQRTTFPFEVLISDDCSTDATLAICNEYATKYSNVKVIPQQKNLGMAANQHFVLSIPKTPFIAYLDSDDYYIASDFLQRQVDFLQQKEDVSVVFSNVQVFSTTGVDRVRYNSENKPPHIFDLHTFLQQGITITNSSMVLRREAHVGVPLFFTDYFQYDWLLHIYHGLKGSFGYNDFIGTRYRIHDSNATKTNTEKIFLDGIKAIPRLREILPEEYKHYFRNSVQDMNKLAFFYLKRREFKKFIHWYVSWLKVVPRDRISMQEQASMFRDAVLNRI